MQDLRSITGGSGGRIFGGERRLRPYPNQALKCPRCDSLNTKFCYYNNYNLSQPRHFCKNCRRYWTKGGVLRNVPVGGGCRKTKRSKPKPSTDLQKERKSNSHSSSESSSLTATTTNTVTEAASSSSAGLLGFPFVSQNPNPNPNPSFEPSMLENLEHNPNFESFCENGSFTSLMTVSNPSILGFNFNGISPFRLHQQQQEQERIRLEQEKMTSMVEEMKMQHELTAGCVDQTVPVSLPGFQNRMTNGELTALDWQSSGDQDHDHDQGLFDMANTVDHGYWSQSQWTDNDHPLYLP